jgi:hypothetical protein
LTRVKGNSNKQYPKGISFGHDEIEPNYTSTLEASSATLPKAVLAALAAVLVTAATTIKVSLLMLRRERTPYQNPYGEQHFLDP